MASAPNRLIALTEVKELTGLGKTMIYRLIRQGDFPSQYKPGGHASRWDEQEIREWRQQQRAA